MTGAPAFSFAYQPIADIAARNVFAYEALVRGAAGQPAAEVLAGVPAGGLHAFDHEARLGAVRLAARLGLETRISLNLLSGAVAFVPGSVDSLIEAARATGLSPQQLLLEVTESEVVHQPKQFANQLNRYRAHGVQTAIDDFGAGFSGLNLLADFQPDLIKLDMHLVRGIDSAGPRQAIVRAVLQACDDLGIEVIAEGIESRGEYDWFRRVGVRLFQGYFLARPGFEALPAPLFPA